jgi:hypothetical protein
LTPATSWHQWQATTSSTLTPTHQRTNAPTHTCTNAHTHQCAFVHTHTRTHVCLIHMLTSQADPTFNKTELAHSIIGYDAAWAGYRAQVGPFPTFPFALLPFCPFALLPFFRCFFFAGGSSVYLSPSHIDQCVGLCAAAVCMPMCMRVHACARTTCKVTRVRVHVDGRNMCAAVRTCRRGEAPFPHTHYGWGLISCVVQIHFCIFHVLPTCNPSHDVDTKADTGLCLVHSRRVGLAWCMCPLCLTWRTRTSGLIFGILLQVRTGGGVRALSVPPLLFVPGNQLQLRI